MTELYIELGVFEGGIGYEEGEEEFYFVYVTFRIFVRYLGENV